MQQNNIKILEEFDDDLDNLYSVIKELRNKNEKLQEKISELEDKLNKYGN